MRDVAARAEVALGTIYRYFPSKDALLLAAMVHWVGDLERRDGRVVAWIDGRPKAVDVVYHRTDEDRFGGTAVGDLLLEPCRAGTVACVNAPGSGVATNERIPVRLRCTSAALTSRSKRSKSSASVCTM